MRLVLRYFILYFTSLFNYCQRLYYDLSFGASEKVRDTYTSERSNKQTEAKMFPESEMECKMMLRAVISPRHCRRRSRCYGRSHANDGCSTFGRTSSAPTFSKKEEADLKQLLLSANRRPEINVATWNIAAPNNNPFEFWSTHHNQDYDNLMSALQRCFDCPLEMNVPIEQIFSHSMYEELKKELTGQGKEELEMLDFIWVSDLSKRKAITEFLKDTSFGEKRLISMPDRMTTSIKTISGKERFRPSPITGILEDMGDIASWWTMWKDYMFHTPFFVKGEQHLNVFSLLQKIPRAKYPALTESEEAISRSMQTLCLALFDAVYTFLLSKIAPETWQPLKRSLIKTLFENKASSCVSILQSQYCDAEVIFVQEASEAFAARAGVCLNHHVLRPTGVDGRRCQMSLILVRKDVFCHSSAVDVTDEVLENLDVKKCVEKGDLCVFRVQSSLGHFLLASFHGDSNGRSTAPVLAALDRLARERYPEHTLIFGLDANMAGEGDGAGDLDSLLAGRGLSSCWEGQDLGSLWTTFNARTHLQPQLQKAVGLSDVLDRRHMRLKDWILFYDSQLAVQDVSRDNTGARDFVTRVMPSPAFPSDHAIVSAKLRMKDPARPVSTPVFRWF